MEKMKFLATLLCTVLLGASLVACSNDDDDYPIDDVDELVKEITPSQGWSGDMTNGTAVYSPRKASYDDDMTAYYAFSFSGGICQEAVYDVVFPSEKYAEQIASALRTGTWVDMDDDDEEDDYYYAPMKTTARRMVAQCKAITRATGDTDINPKDFALTVYRKGKVVFIVIECLQGKSSTDVKDLVVYWEDKTMMLPDRFVTGKWDESAGYYVNTNLLNHHIIYEVQVDFKGDLVSGYVTTITCPNAAWAQMMYETLEEQNASIYKYYGIRPEARISGNKVEEIAYVGDNVTRDYILTMLHFIDWTLSRPFLVNIFA